MRQLDYAAMRHRIPIRRVLDLLHYEPARRQGHQWRGSCPLLCASSSTSRQGRCFSVHLGRNLFRCFQCHRSGNQLDLWVAITDQPLYSATLDLCRRLGIEPIELENPQPPNVD